MVFYFEKSLYEEYKENIYTALEFFHPNNCTFSILRSLGYLCGALNRTFIETSTDTISIDLDEWNDYFPHLQKTINYLSNSSIEHNIKLTSMYEVYNLYMAWLNANSKSFFD